MYPVIGNLPNLTATSQALNIFAQQATATNACDGGGERERERGEREGEREEGERKERGVMHFKVQYGKCVSREERSHGRAHFTRLH